MNNDLIHSLNSLRLLSIDMISYANSGHPGICLGAAPMLYSLYSNFLRIHPANPNWVNRDRFVLSAGHGSALLYATLFMAGYPISIDDLVNFRRIHSITPGHPEVGVTPGVDATTGALGQGFATAVGMAIAEKYLEALLEEQLPKQKIIHYNIYTLVGDGDLQEGVTLEAASIAGNLALDNLIVLYDSNTITLDGPLSNSSNEDIIRKFLSMNWEVDFVSEGNDTREIDKAIERAKVNKKPTLIEIKTVIGRGSVHEGTNVVHGKPLTKEDVANLRAKYKINTNTLEITEDAVNYFRKSIHTRMADEYEKWQTMYNDIRLTTQNEALIKILNFLDNQDVGLDFDCTKFKIQNDYFEELRESNSKILNIISDRTKFFLGGSADLSSTCHSSLYKELNFTNKYRLGRNLSFGVREHAMGAILNGISLSGIKTFGSTFLTFSDYLKPAIRFSALMNLPVTYIFTHDSVRIGQDGKTHQPIEQLVSLRATPNLTVFRPADINEVIGCWDYIAHHRNPVAVVLSKEEAHILAGTDSTATKYGGYIVKKEENRLDCVLVSTGIDFTTTYLIREELRNKGYDIRLVSMPSLDLFLEQPSSYQEQVIPSSSLVFTIEASSTMGWYQVASKNCAIGINRFGLSGLKEDVLKEVQFDYDSILKRIEEKLQQTKLNIIR